MEAVPCCPPPHHPAPRPADAMADPKPTEPAPLADKLREALAEVPKGRTGREPSQLREYVARVFPELDARRKAGAAWDGLAAPFAALGILMPDGAAPTGADLRNAFHAERYKRGDKRERRKRPKAPPAPAQPAAAAPPAPPAPAVDPPPAPEPPKASGGPFSTGDVALDRALNSVRTLTPLPPRELPGGWRGRTKPTKEDGGDGEDG